MEKELTYNDIDYLGEVMKSRFGFREEGDDSTDDLYSKYWMGQLPNHNKDLITLASYRRAVARFVKIATRKNIPVMFNVKGHSYVTDKENKVVLSAVCKNKDFDSAVGLALHESSHILWTDWNAIANLVDTYGWVIPESMVADSRRIGFTFDGQLRELVKSFENYIEDRRIDDLMIKMIPGYEPYYTALYKKYFGAKIITAGLQSSFARELTLKSYQYRIFNHINPASDRNALPGLGEIIDLINVENISRLENTQEVIDVAIEVVKVILKNMPDYVKEEPKENDESQDGEGESNDGGNESSKNPMDDYEDAGDLDDSDPDSGSPEPGEESENNDNTDDEVSPPEEDDSPNGENDDSDENDKPKNPFDDYDADEWDGEESYEDESDETSNGSGDADGSDENSEESDESGNENNDGNETDENEDDNESDDGNESTGEEADEEPEEIFDDLTEKEIKNLAKEIKTQSDMLDGEIDKKGLDAKDAKTLKDIEDSGTTVEHVQGDSTNGMDVLVVRKLNKDIMKTFKVGSSNIRSDSQRAVINGTRLGKILARKIQVRNETKVYRSKRKTAGKIDRRLLHQLGVGTSQIFEKINKDEYGNAQVHITIDASGSMNGLPWENTMTSAVAIAYAATQVENLEVVISFRGTFGRETLTNRKRNPYTHETVPLMVVAYDSRKDKFKKIQTLFPYLKTFGITPEGLCYEAVMKDILSSMIGKDGYFINFSDGYPNMINENLPYGKRMSATEIAKYNVDKIRANGVKILSFYLTDDDGTNPDLTSFKFMYGNEATYIDVTKVLPLARELNKLFLKK